MSHIITRIHDYLIDNYHSVKHFLFESSYEVPTVVTITSIAFEKNFEEFLHYIWAIGLAITLMILKAWLEPKIKDCFKKEKEKDADK